MPVSMLQACLSEVRSFVSPNSVSDVIDRRTSVFLRRINHKIYEDEMSCLMRRVQGSLVETRLMQGSEFLARSGWLCFCKGRSLGYHLCNN